MLTIRKGRLMVRLVAVPSSLRTTCTFRLAPLRTPHSSIPLLSNVITFSVNTRSVKGYVVVLLVWHAGVLLVVSWIMTELTRPSSLACSSPHHMTEVVT